MPVLRDRLIKQVYRPPFDADNVRAFAFILRGDPATIQAKVLDRTLGPGFVPWSIGGLPGFVLNLFNMQVNDLFIASWMHYGSLESDTLPDVEQGTHGYRESVLYNLVEGTPEVHPDLRKPLIYIPALFLDRSAPAASGREVFGYPKSWGAVSIPQDLPPFNPGPDLVTDAHVVKEYGPVPNRPEREMVMRAVPDPGNMLSDQVRPDDTPSKQFIDAAAEAFRPFMARVHDEVLADALLQMFRVYSLFPVDMVFLKQMRSAENRPPQHETVYQSHVRSRVQVGPRDIRRAVLLDNYKVKIGNQDSTPLARSYGVPVAQGGTHSEWLTPLMSFWIDLDFTQDFGQEYVVPQDPVNPPGRPVPSA